MATLKVDGKVYENVKKIKAKTDTDTTVDFVDTSDATATASDITSGKSAYVNGEIVIGTGIGFEGDTVANAMIDGSITEISSDVETINNYSFAYKDSLSTANFPNATTVKGYAFFRSGNLINISIPKATTIGSNAFYECKKLQSISLPNIKTIPEYCFYSCNSLTEIDIRNVESVGNYGFQSCNITNIDLEKCITIGHYAFNRCNQLKTINLPYCEKIGSYGFQSTKVTSVDLPMLKTTDTYCFQYCKALVNFNAPNIEYISNSCFYSCILLEKLDFNSIRNIGTNAFMYCSKLNTLIIRRSTICSLGNVNAFLDTLIQKGTGYIYVPDELVEEYKVATNWVTYASQIKGISELPAE